jgi:PAS domain S-box-containing protein
MCVEMKHAKGSEAPHSAFPAQPGTGPPRETARLTQRYAAAVESAMDGYAVLGPQRQFLEVNTALCALCGYTRDELLRLAIPDVEAAETESEVAAHAASVAASGRERFETRWKRKDGSVVDVEVAITYDAQSGEFFMFAHDITERKRLAEALTTSENRLRNIIGSVDGIVWEADASTFDFTFISPQAERLLGYRIEDWLKPSFWVQHLHPEDKEWAPEYCASCTRKLEPHDFEYRFIASDGRVVWLHDIVTVVQEQGRPRWLRGIMVDITERKRLENEVRENEALLRGMFEQNVSAMFVIEDGAFTYANRRAGEVLGGGSRALLGRPILELVAEADRPMIARVMQALLSGQIKTTNCDFAAVREDGAFVDVGAGMTRAMLRGKTVILGVAQDIGERKKAQEKIDHYVERLERTVWSTLGVISRMVDLRDPYTAGHERRVSALAKAIGAELGLGEERCSGLEAMGLIHDVGKIAAPSEVLSRPGKLTAAEFELVKLHAQFGYEIVKNAEFPWPVAESILQHHERLDGSGYPRGLKGEEILLEARIIAVADVVEAMSSHRPYRAALGIEKALAELVEHRGTRYDAAAVDACVKLFREGYSLE